MGMTGAFGEYGQAFHPDEKITVGTLLRAMLMLQSNNQPNSQDSVMNDEDVLKAAKAQGWIHEDLDLGSELSRMDLSKIMIRLINMEPSAQVKGILFCSFYRCQHYSTRFTGVYCSRLGTGHCENRRGYLQPSQTVTRADAAYALVHAYAAVPQNSNNK